MGRRRGEKENKTGNDPQGASRAKIIVDLFHGRLFGLITSHSCYRVAPAFFSPSRARSGVIGPMTTSRIVPWPSMKNVAGGPKMR